MLAACSLVGGPEPRRAGPSGPTGLLAAQAPQRGERRGGRYRRGVLETFRTDVPDHPYDIVLGNPTGTSVIASVLSYSPVEGYIEFGTRPGEYETRSDRIRLATGKPAELTLDGLVAHTRYYYRWRSRAGLSEAFEASDESAFRTGRNDGDGFVFTVQADPHLDGRTDPRLYEASLRNAAKAGPDFHVDLGDTFMTGKRRGDYGEALPQYLAQRYYFGLIGASAPVFLVSGNHDGEGIVRSPMGDWAREQRRAYFATPSDRFANRGTYYRWEWGNALFVALDPFWKTPRVRPGGDYWLRTLGQDQYRWFRETLESSRAKFKFVFIHHLVGGINQAARGGVSAAGLFEWGGHGFDGAYEFDDRRPGWGKPIHRLLVETGVSILFHGHDHVFAREELDGVIYQLVPQPGLDRYGAPRTVAGGYENGEVIGGPGHVRVTVSSDEALVELIQTRREGVEAGNGRTTYSYRVAPHCKGACR